MQAKAAQALFNHGVIYVIIHYLSGAVYSIQNAVQRFCVFIATVFSLRLFASLCPLKAISVTDECVIHRDSMTEYTPPPPPSTHQYLSAEAINAWRISGFMGSLFYWIIPIGYGIVAIGSSLPGWPVWVLAALFMVFTISEASWLPWLRWKRWRYRVDQHEIDLQQGIFVVTRTLIPVKRVQHVDTRQGPIYRSFELASVTITTAGDTHEIPALSEPVADELRRTISEYARVAKEDL